MSQFKRIVAPSPAAPRSSTPNDATLRALFLTAHASGMAAANSLGMESNDPMLAMSCGFAWVNLKPTRSRAASLFKEMGEQGCFAGMVKHSEYERAMQLWVNGPFRQSEPHKSAYADAFADVLRNAGLDAHSGSRLD